MNRYANLAPLLIRIALAAVFIMHGLPKFQHTEGVAGFFGQIGIPAPYLMTLLVGLVELLGGILLLTPFFTRLVGGLLAANMLVAIFTAKRSAGFVGGWEFDLVLLLAALSLVLSGPGNLKPVPDPR